MNRPFASSTRTPLPFSGAESLFPAWKQCLARARLSAEVQDWERRLIQRLRELHYAWRTEEAYRGWAWRYNEFLALRARELEKAGAEDLRGFLSELAVKDRVS